MLPIVKIFTSCAKLSGYLNVLSYYYKIDHQFYNAIFKCFITQTYHF